MENSQRELNLEKNRLTETITLARRLIGEAQQRNEENKSDIISAKQDLRDNTMHSIGDISGSDAFEALAELNQYMDPITNKIADYEAVEDEIIRLERVVKDPYFARIDFKFDDEETFEKIYIGRSSLKEDNIKGFWVYDWRSPIASVFYRFMLGEVYYDAPAGRISGAVNLKRQYEIQSGELDYFFDTEVQIVDEFLKKMLSQNTSPQMKTIVETIQKEQDIVIRDMDNELMMVQGVAGSGKTSIALHRAAYLMYQGLTVKLTAENIMIISPNPLFEQYIAQVLPELGEENIQSTVLEHIFSTILHKNQIQSRNRFLGNLISSERYRELIKSSIEFKTSRAFIEILDRLILDIPHRWIAFENVNYDGRRVIGKRALKGKILSGLDDTPLGMRLALIKKYLLDQIRTTHKGGIKESERIFIEEEKLKFMEIDLDAIVRELFFNKEYFYQLAQGIALPPMMDEIITFTQENLSSSQLYYDDAAVLTYLNLKVYGVHHYKNIKQVVIDEAQDYYPLHFEIFKLLFGRAKFTILGDINQTLEKNEDISLYEQIRHIFDKKRSSLVTMDKSFRCTTEILNYSMKFLNQTSKVKGFNRHGEQPKNIVVPDERSLSNAIIEEVKCCQELGYQSTGLICKTEENARRLYALLKDKMEIELITHDKTVELQGVFIIPVYMSKGLEFDAVLVCDADAKQYNTDDDKKLLYIAATRALHRLNLFSQGEASPLL